MDSSTYGTFKSAQDCRCTAGGDSGEVGGTGTTTSWTLAVFLPRPPSLSFHVERAPAILEQLFIHFRLNVHSLNSSYTMSETADFTKGYAAWFDERPSESQIPPSARQLLETYSGIPSDEVVDHVVNLRNEAWKIHPYPCIGQFRFLEPGINVCPEYNEVIERLRKGQKLLDMACCFGQTTRRLVADGAPSENIYACDLQADFIELGYKLFKDRDKLRTKFLVADIFDPSSPLMELQKNVDIIYTGSFFHLWGLEKQREVSKAVALLLRRTPGSMIVGRQMGAVDAMEKTSTTGTMYRHNADSFKKLWKEIGDDLGVSFKVDARLEDLNRDHFKGDDTKRIYFSIRRE
jgi:SAM-dependent methyltransferase